MPGDNTIKVDYLIIGQGLAGTLLAWHLLQRGKRVLIADDGHRSSSSMVAAGLINPLAGKRFAAPDRLGSWLTTAMDCYQTLEQQLQLPIWHALDMVRILHSADQQRHLRSLYQDPSRRHYIGARVDTELGGFMQTQTGYLDMPALLNRLNTQWSGSDLLINSSIDYAQFKLSAHLIDWQQMQASRVIFCEGWRGQNNPWFQHLPFAPAKGEILTMESADPLPNNIINGAHWVMPLSTHRFRFGSTYEHQHLDMHPSPAGRTQLLQGVTAMLPDHHELRLIDHRAGVRPATSDRKPFIGMHPEHPRIGIFNGFGSRGALLIPWYAQQFVQHLEDGSELPAESLLDPGLRSGRG